MPAPMRHAMPLPPRWLRADSDASFHFRYFIFAIFFILAPAIAVFSAAICRRHASADFAADWYISLTRPGFRRAARFSRWVFSLPDFHLPLSLLTFFHAAMPELLSLFSPGWLFSFYFNISVFIFIISSIFAAFMLFFQRSIIVDFRIAWYIIFFAISLRYFQLFDFHFADIDSRFIFIRHFHYAFAIDIDIQIFSIFSSIIIFRIFFFAFMRAMPHDAATLSVLRRDERFSPRCRHFRLPPAPLLFAWFRFSPLLSLFHFSWYFLQLSIAPPFHYYAIDFFDAASISCFFADYFHYFAIFSLMILSFATLMIFSFHSPAFDYYYWCFSPGAYYLAAFSSASCAISQPLFASARA